MDRKPKINSENVDNFIFGAKDEKTKLTEQNHEQQKQQPKPQKEIDLDKLRRQTYYITELFIQSIDQMAFYEQMDKSEIVRSALEQYIPKKYIQLAIKK